MPLETFDSHIFLHPVSHCNHSHNSEQHDLFARWSFKYHCENEFVEEAANEIKGQIALKWSLLMTHLINHNSHEVIEQMPCLTCENYKAQLLVRRVQYNQDRSEQKQFDIAQGKQRIELLSIFLFLCIFLTIVFHILFFLMCLLNLFNCCSFIFLGSFSFLLLDYLLCSFGSFHRKLQRFIFFGRLTLLDFLAWLVPLFLRFFLRSHILLTI